jgi:hypothetical protein
MKADNQALTAGVEGIAVAPGSLSDRLFIAKAAIRHRLIWGETIGHRQSDIGHR